MSDPETTIAKDELLDSSEDVFISARKNLADALATYDRARRVGDKAVARVALMSVAYGCDSLKACANAYGALTSQIERGRSR